MYTKSIKYLLLIALISGIFASVVNAQTTALTIRVYIEQPDKQKVPLQDAVIEMHRRDMGGVIKLKTNKSGQAVHAAVPYGQYTILVSGPGATPTTRVKVPLSQYLAVYGGPNGNELEFILTPGDGRVLTLEQAEKNAPAAASAESGGGSGGSGLSKEEIEKRRKAAEEYEKEKERVENINARLSDALKKGNEALTAKKYDEAITFYDQGIQLDPSQWVFPRNKAVAVRIRAVDKFNKAGKDLAARENAKADIKVAADSIEKAIVNYQATAKKEPSAGATAAAPKQDNEKDLLYERAETYRLALEMGVLDLADPAVKGIQEYIDKETDQAKKTKAQGNLANAMLSSGQMDRAITLSQQILTSNPNNLDAMYVLAIATASDPEKAAEARDLLKKFASKAPPEDPRKQMAEDTAKGLDEVLKAPAKTETKPTRRRG
jgi:tetratricopeptide (TPR) repeat protein